MLYVCWCCQNSLDRTLVKFMYYFLLLFGGEGTLQNTIGNAFTIFLHILGYSMLVDNFLFLFLSLYYHCVVIRN